MNIIRAVIASFRQELKTTATSIADMSFLFSAMGRSAALAWIALQTGDQALLSYIYVGVPLMEIWWGVVFRTGWTLTQELFHRTLDFSLISRASMVLILLGKAFAEVVYGLSTGIAALITVFFVTYEPPIVSDVGLLVCSLIFAIVGLIATCLLFSPLMVLAGGRGGFFNAIMPFGALLSGFIIPAERLPLMLGVAARLLPGSWAMDSVWQSIQGVDSGWQVIRGWSMCILLSAVWFSITYLMCKTVEKRIRVTGTLGTY